MIFKTYKNTAEIDKILSSSQSPEDIEKNVEDVLKVNYDRNVYASKERETRIENRKVRESLATVFGQDPDYYKIIDKIDKIIDRHKGNTKELFESIKIELNNRQTLNQIHSSLKQIFDYEFNPESNPFIKFFIPLNKEVRKAEAVQQTIPVAIAQPVPVPETAAQPAPETAAQESSPITGTATGTVAIAQPVPSPAPPALTTLKPATVDPASAPPPPPPPVSDPPSPAPPPPISSPPPTPLAAAPSPSSPSSLKPSADPASTAPAPKPPAIAAAPSPAPPPPKPPAIAPTPLAAAPSPSSPSSLKPSADPAAIAPAPAPA